MTRRRVALLLAIAACATPLSTSPLSPIEGAVIDPEVIGTWESTDGDDKNIVHITVRAGGVMTVVMRGPHATVELWAHRTTIGGKQYVSARQNQNGRLSQWVFGRYAIDKKGALTVWSLRSVPIAEAIRSGALKGEADDDVVISDKPEKLVALIKADKGEALFELFGTFKRKKAT